MSNKIISIEEVFNKAVKDTYSNMDGYRIKTEDSTYSILISNDQCCCESWGYFTSEDDVSDYIGSELLSVEVVDKALNNKKLEEEVSWGLDSGEAVFVNFNTSNGVLQFAVYNSHNGYYGHECIVDVFKNKEREELVNTWI